MFINRVIAVAIILISFGVFTGCQYDKLMKSDDFDAKLVKPVSIMQRAITPKPYHCLISCLQ